MSGFSMYQLDTSGEYVGYDVASKSVTWDTPFVRVGALVRRRFARAVPIM
jgi:hypothetical protein